MSGDDENTGVNPPNGNGTSEAANAGGDTEHQGSTEQAPSTEQPTLEEQLTILRTTGKCRIGLRNSSYVPLAVAARTPLASLSHPQIMSVNRFDLAPQHVHAVEEDASPHDSSNNSVQDSGKADPERVKAIMDILSQNFEHLDKTQREQLTALIEQFADRFALADSDITQTHLVTHEIDTGNERPVKVPLRRHPYTKRLFIAETVKKLLDLKLIRASKSPWSSPVHPVPKDDSWRFCVDFREVNKRTRVDAFPAANIEGLLSQLSGKKYFSVVDCQSGYWQIKMHANSIEKTAFTVENGHYEWLVLPFGLCNAGATFQRFMETLFSDMINSSLYIYVDDLGVASATWEEHLEDLRKVFTRLREANLRLKAKKCRLAQLSAKFLGHIVSAEGISMDSDKVKAVIEYPQPGSVKQLQRFLGMAGYYRRFIKNYAARARPLHNLLNKDTKFAFSPECCESMDDLKRCIAYEVTLAFPNFEAAISDSKRGFIIETDGSRDGVGAVISQKDSSGRLRPIYFASRSLKKSEKNYSATELEALAVRFACYKFAYYITGIPTTVITDHQALVPLFRQPSANSRVDGWARELGCRFTIKVVYRAGRENKCADALSRDLPASESTPDEDESDETNWIAFGAIDCLQHNARKALQSAVFAQQLVPADPAFELEAPDDPSEFDKDAWNMELRRDEDLRDVLQFLSARKLPEGKAAAHRVVALSGLYQLHEGLLFHVDSDGNLRLVVPPAHRELLIRERHAARVLDIKPNSISGWGLFEKCEKDAEGHSTCAPLKATDICRGATFEGQKLIQTIAQHAIAMAIVKKLPPALAAKIIEEMLTRADPLTWLEGQQTCFPERIRITAVLLEKALMARFATCNVARRFLKESAYLPIRFDEFRLEEGMNERLAELLEELRAQQFLGNGKVIQQKIVVVGDSNAEELAAGINGARLFGKSTQAVAAELYDVILGGSVKLVIVAVGRDDIHKGTAMEQIIGNMKAILSTLAQYKHVKVFVFPPPWMPMYKAEYCAFVAAMHMLTGSSNIPELGDFEWSDETKKELEEAAESKAVFLHRHKGRDFIEMSRMGTGQFRKWADINGHLTEFATRTIVEVLQDTLKVEGLKLSEHAASGAEDKRGEKRTYYNSGGFRGGHGKRDRRNN